MRVIEYINDLKAIVRSQKSAGKSIGFVPTMGYLHEGHISLVKSSLHDNEFTIMSIFVNPTQFGPNEDFGKYPRDLDRDLIMAENAGVDVVFVPSVQEMYPEGYVTYVNVEEITQKLCGQSRPGHFKGVTTIVNKFFNIVEPNKAYLGRRMPSRWL
jgi:pantoate--beta-alanine ligase